MQPLTLIAIFACAEALWRRRSTWRSRWDAAVTYGVALEGINVLCMEPGIGIPLSPWIYNITGVWNIEELVGHLLHLEGLMCVLYMAISRLKLSDGERRRMMRTRLELPGIVITAVAVALFVYGAPQENIGDLMLTRPEGLMFAYWSVMGLSTLYLASSSIWALSIIARNPECRPTANVCIFACSVSIATCVAGVTDLIRPVPDLMWCMVRVELLAYTIAALYSWNYRTWRMVHARLEFPASA